MKLIENFSKVKALVIGDLILDRYWWGDVSRISPEAPVPVVRLKKNTFAAGGAANVAANIAGLGATPYLVGGIGDDVEAESFRTTLEKSNVSGEHVITLPHRKTTVKTRIIAHNQQVVRVDYEIIADLTVDEEAQIRKAIDNTIEKADIVIVSDYAKGLLTGNILTHLISTATQFGKMVLVDPKGKNYSKYAGATLLTPNRREAAEACNLEEGADDIVEIAGNKLLAELDLTMLLITQSEDGMTLFSRNSEPARLRAEAKEIYDVTGAGDTVIAFLGVALAAGLNLLDAAKIANLGAGLAVEQIGTSIITIKRLLEALEHSKETGNLSAGSTHK